MNFHSEIEKIKELQLPQSDVVVVGSGALAVRGIRDSKDVDVMVTPDIWNTLAQKFIVRRNESDVETIYIGEYVEILNPRDSLFGDSRVVPIDDIFRDAELIDGIAYISLEHLKQIKLYMGREKDLADVKLIDQYLVSR